MAALINASTGYDSLADFTDQGPEDSLDSGSSLEDPHGAGALALKNHTTGYDSIADFTDQGPEDFLDSGSFLEYPFGIFVEGDHLTEGDTGEGSTEVWGVIGG
jgi:hypothetical protein